MIDQEVVAEATELLAKVIAERVAAVNPAVIAALNPEPYAARVRAIEVLGADVAALTAAIGVLARRVDPARPDR